MSFIELSILPQQLVNGVLLGAIYALIALGYTMVYGVLRLINFAHGEVFMIGAYVALLVSWSLGFSPETLKDFSQQGTVITLLVMLLVSMGACAILGILIEFLAYRPLRNHPRIASLTTAIGVSLLLQYGGVLFLPITPPPNIAEQVNPFNQTLHFYLKPPNSKLVKETEVAKQKYLISNQIFEKKLKYETTKMGKTNEFDLTPEGRALRVQRQFDLQNYRQLKGKQDASGYQVYLSISQLIMLGVTLILMVALHLLVMKTQIGRAMRAVSHHFDTASLMGINVNKVITFTFIIGSALAGAGAMMNATFLGTPLTTFYGALPGLKAFIAAVLGGIGNIYGAVLGGLVMGIAEALTVWLGYSLYKDAVAFLLLIVILLWRPGGLLGSKLVEKV